MSRPVKTRSNIWFLLPILFGVIGGAIAFFIFLHHDKRKAMYSLFIGVLSMMLGIILNFWVIPPDIAINPGFDVRV